MIPQITALYAGLLGLIYLVISGWVVRVRMQQKVFAGDKGDPVMANAIRVHANFAEYVPICLFLILLAEMQGAPSLALHLLGVALLVSRVMHALGMATLPHKSPLRGGGALLTFLVLFFGAAANIGHALF
ncbi:MAPEG family protein [Seohaeicola saemankumensis]|uniref:MAPEG family protein n=1 Tax=Seohaeicola saemankumensis TaxID=481181 RepID=UPI001E49518C|nr:MAPEG family protein [Seohaeicola saemankumensis]MCD1626493.1 MAPEG family protein [Seohaeicola saemankumensis]